MSMAIAQQHSFSCRRVAVLSDIHSNSYALQACLEDARKEGAEGYIFLGDYISGLAATVSTMELVYAVCAVYPTCSIIGNREQYMLQYRKDGRMAFPGPYQGVLYDTYEALREQDMAFFEELPMADTVCINGVTFEVAHALRDNTRYYFDHEHERLADAFALMETPYLLTGHSHRQYERRQEEKTIINPGAVGLPQDYGHLAQYALLDVADGAVTCIFRQVDYDVETLIGEQFDSGFVERAACGAVSDLYAAMVGEGYTKKLINAVEDCGGSDATPDIWRIGYGLFERGSVGVLAQST